MKRVLSEAEVEIVKRSDRQKGFVVLPRRWVVECTLAWLNRCRRLAKDWENLSAKARAFLVLASAWGETRDGRNHAMSNWTGSVN